jgi:hypothetical protein
MRLMARKKSTLGRANTLTMNSNEAETMKHPVFRFRRCAAVIFTFLAFVFHAPGPAIARTATTEAACIGEEHRLFSLYIENDVLAGDDNQYTNGLKLTWSRFGLSGLPDDAWLHKWLYPAVRAAGWDDPRAEKALTFSIGQNIYTPDNIEETELIPDDRPYAGITYAELGYHKRISNRMHTIGLCAGIVGPDSYAEEMQTTFHDILNSSEPRGWDNQLENEPVICLVYDYRRRLFGNPGAKGFGNNVIYSFGASLGNALTAADTGLMWRIGWRIPSDFGSFPIQPANGLSAEMEEQFCRTSERRFGVHGFLSASGRAVAHNIFLDGNTFRDSHSVDKKPFFATFTGGLGMVKGRLKAVLAYVYRTKEFEAQDDPQIYGSLNISVRY